MINLLVATCSWSWWPPTRHLQCGHSLTDKPNEVLAIAADSEDSRIDWHPLVFTEKLKVLRAAQTLGSDSRVGTAE